MEEQIQNKHREWLKSHEGKRYKVCDKKENIDKSKWKKDYRDEKYDPQINLIEINENELVGEIDEESKIKENRGKVCTKEERYKWIDETIAKLESENVGYDLFDHKGKCPHIHLFLNKEANKNKKESILKYYFPKDSWEFVDTSLCGSHLIAVPYSPHYKYGTIKDLIKNKGGLIIDVEDEKYGKEEVIEKKIDSKRTTSITDKIKEKIKITDLANEYGVIKGKETNNYHCPFHNDKHPSLSLNDALGWFKCFASSCGKSGNIIDFVAELESISRKEAIHKLIEKAGLSDDGRYSSIFKSSPQGIIQVDYQLMAKIFLMDQPYFYDKHHLWWFWNHANFKWEIVDDVDVMNEIDRGLKWSGTIDSKIKGKILEALKRVGRLNTPKEPKKVWVQFYDTIVDIENGNYFPATPEYFITNPLPWQIGESEETPNLDRIFEEWVGKEYVTTLKEIMAYCTLTYIPIHRIFCLIGSGLNGKGSYLRLIEKFVGEENATSTTIERLTKGQFETSKLYKKLVAIIGEIDKSIFSRTALLKALSGDDLLPIEFKGKDSWNAHLYATPIIATNALPESTDNSKGFYRRWTIVDFPNQFNEKKDIIKDVPEQEFSNFCKQIPKILRELLQRGEFVNDGSIEQREERYKERSNPISHFIRAKCDIGKEFRVQFGDFYEEYKLFLETNGHKEMSDNMVGRILTNMGYESKVIPIGTSSQRFRIGIKLKEGVKNDEN
ncbi:MAG: phage/plasmid primase, P4 family [Candidatus Pacearchaeota archaeon]|jgi:P4 family phage/plasmid primase-like protien